MASNHTFGESCLLKEEGNTFTRRASAVANEAPKITAQFFYCSALPIDDPLAAIPAPSSSSATKSTRVPPRPFSVHDNLALDKAWLKLPHSVQKLPIESAQPYQTSEKVATRRNDSSSELYAASIPSKRQGESNLSARLTQSPQRDESFEDNISGGGSVGTRVIKPEPSLVDRSNGMVPSRQDESKQIEQPLRGDQTSINNDDHLNLQDAAPVSVEEMIDQEVEAAVPKPRRSRSFFRRSQRGENSSEDLVSSRSSSRRLSRGRQEVEDSTGAMSRSPDTTGTPFLRVPARLRHSRSHSPDHGGRQAQFDGPDSRGRDYRPKHSSPLSPNPKFAGPQDQDRPDSDSETEEQGMSSQQQKKSQDVEATQVTVGILRLHVVEMPSLKMGPIYWDPIHDVSSVVRGTWFYRDTMWPVESDLANQIEEGYEYMKPWTPTYIDELNSCMDIGPEAELKVAHKIWPNEETQTSRSRPSTSTNRELGREERHVQEAKKVASLPGNRAAGVLEGFEPPDTGRLFAKSSIIYANGRDAQILKPSQLPSAAKGRRPLGNIRKGKTVGIPLVRGFDMKAWENINPLPNRGVPTSQNMPGETVKSLKRRKSCLACESATEKPMPTDLILVVHGIGQKLSERVESFHFTHAINAFRRQINMELNNDAVKPWLRQDLAGIMVLPINWRSTLKLDSGGPEPNPNQKEAGNNNNQFTLKDITAESLPAVRNLISDVMLDIPYYLSHHKPKMIEAVVTEANRIYRKWCINNPAFHMSGRVHLLAHSLGSVMALDILSKQPTRMPQQVNYPPRSGKVRKDMFEFNTTSLFFCGSPAGFFLLLNRAPLVPRFGREKPNAEAEEVSTGVTGQVGTFGCLAVDNLYNILHYNDPIAYRMNACVDVDYAASLQTALIPSTSPTWSQQFGSYFHGKAGSPTMTMTGLNELPRRPTTARLPTTVELETHNFSKEEIAEKRMFLLNDNGQIDYILPSGGGPLEIQYLNMLGAHSSYWTRQDFIRFLVMEVGRKPGKTEAVPGNRAVKKGYGKK